MNVLKSHFEANGLQYGQYPAHSVDKSMELMFESQSNSIASAPLLHSYPPMASAPPHVPFFVVIPEQEREKRREERLRFLASRRTPRLSKAFINKQCLRVKQSSQPPPVPAPAPGRTAAGGAQRTAPVEDEEDDDNEYNDDEFEETGAIDEGAPMQQPPAANDSDDSGEDYETVSEDDGDDEEDGGDEEGDEEGDDEDDDDDEDGEDGEDEDEDDAGEAESVVVGGVELTYRDVQAGPAFASTMLFANTGKNELDLSRLVVMYVVVCLLLLFDWID